MCMCDRSSPGGDMNYSINQLQGNLWCHVVAMDAMINVSASLTIGLGLEHQWTDTLQPDEAGYSHMVGQWVYRANPGGNY